MEENKTEISTENTSSNDTVTTNTAETADTANNANDANNVETTETKKKSKLPVILVAILAVVAIIAAVVVLNFQAIENSIKKATMSDEEYAQYIITKNAAQSAEFYANMYDKSVLSIFSDKIETTTTVSGKITEDGFEFLDDAGLDMDDYEDIDFIKDEMSISYTAKHDGDVSFVSLGYTSGKNSIFTAELIFDKANQMVYTRVPEFNEEYAALDLEDFYDDDEIDELYSIIDSLDEVGNILISADQLESIIKRYQAVAIAEIDDVDVSADTLEVGDIEQKVTVIEFELDNEDFVNIAMAVAKELIDDDEIKQIVEDISEIELIEDSDEFVEDYEDFLDELEEAIDDYDDESSDNDNSAEIAYYVDNKGNIIGYKFNITVESYYDTEEFEMFCAYAVKGSNFALEMYAEENGDKEFTVEGEGKAKGTKFSGVFTVEADDEEVEFEVTNLDWTKWSQGIVDGNISVSLDQFGKDIPKAFRDLSVNVSMNGSKSTYGFSLYDDKTLLMSYEISTTVSNNPKVSIPKNTVEVEDGDDIADYIEDFDLSSIDSIIEDLDLDIDTEDLVEEYAEELGYLVEENLPIEVLLIPELGVSTNPITPVLVGVMTPQLYRYMLKANAYSNY